MAAFLIADVLPEDVEGYRSSGYLEAAMKTAGDHGGVYRARGGTMSVLEGDWHPGRLVVIEFPSMEDLHAWYTSEEYGEWIEVRRKFVPNSRLIALEGV